MPKEIRADYSVQMLFPKSLEDYVPHDHPARFIRELVDCLDLTELGFKTRESEDGRPNYASDLLLKVWLYGYMDRVRSTRRLEKMCRDNMALIWLTGNNAPDHNTLWRFFNENGNALKGLFKQAVKVAMNSGLVWMALHAVDGTKIQARCSNNGMLSREDAEKILRRLDETAECMMREVEENEACESGEYRLPTELADRESLRAKLRESLAKMDEIERDLIQPVEPDARMMNVSGQIKPAYNAQAVVDSKSGIIVAENVVDEENDSHQLNLTLDEVEENIGRVADETVADAGYYTAEELSSADDRNRSVIVNANPGITGDEFEWTRFKYDEQNDCVICPMGKRLQFSCIDRSEKEPRREYRCRNFRDCPRRFECSSNKRQGRRIRIGPHHSALMRNAAKLMDEESRKLLARRKCTVEPVFGIIKENMGFRRWSAGGLANVRAQWSLMCTAFNLNKMLKFWNSGSLKLITG